MLVVIQTLASLWTWFSLCLDLLGQKSIDSLKFCFYALDKRNKYKCFVILVMLQVSSQSPNKEKSHHVTSSNSKTFDIDAKIN